MVNCINLIIQMSPRFVLGRENVPCVAEVVNRLLKADCTDFKMLSVMMSHLNSLNYFSLGLNPFGPNLFTFGWDFTDSDNFEGQTSSIHQII